MLVNIFSSCTTAVSLSWKIESTLWNLGVFNTCTSSAIMSPLLHFLRCQWTYAFWLFCPLEFARFAWTISYTIRWNALITLDIFHTKPSTIIWNLCMNIHINSNPNSNGTVMLNVIATNNACCLKLCSQWHVKGLFLMGSQCTHATEIMKKHFCCCWRWRTSMTQS